jgi:uncharacterized protein YndB with AHSA1/START domain
MENRVTHSKIFMNIPAAAVWNGLVNPELIKHYLFGSEVVSDWKEGSAIIYKGNYQGKTFEDKGTVIKVDPERLLVMTHWSPLSGMPDLPENYHTVTYTLTPVTGGTEVTINQDNNASEEERQQNEKFWTSVLQNMKRLLEAM